MKEYGVRVSEKFVRRSFTSLKPKKYKGEVCIQLFDEKTGRLEKEVKGENMVTNAVADIFASNYFGLLQYQNLLPIRDLFGGVLCFRNALTENANNYYPPLSSTNEVIAHAGQTTYESAEADVTRGIPNSVESGVVTNGYKFVWDFASSQGNGTISALSLTHKDAGDFWIYGGTNFAPIKSFDLPSGSRFIREILFWDDDNRVAYSCEGSGKSLSLIEYKGYAAISGLGLNEENLLTKPDDNLVVEAHTISLPRAWNATKYLFLKEDREIHALYASGNTIERVIIDLTDFSTTRSDITVSGADFRTFEYAFESHTFGMELDDDGFLYLQSNTANVKYKMQYSNPTNIISVSAPSLTQTASQPFTGIGHFGLICSGVNGLIVDGAVARSCAINTENDDSVSTTRWRSPVRCGNRAPVFYMPASQRWDTVINYPRLALYKLYMATIYNLQNPVAKQATQTMKITYTITEVQGNE